MNVVLGNKNVALIAGKTDDNGYMIKMQRCSRELTVEMINSGEWKNYIDNSACVLEFKNIEGLNSLIKLCKYIKALMLEELEEGENYNG